MKAIPSDEMRKVGCLTEKDGELRATRENPFGRSDLREKVNGVAFLLDEVFSVLHELPQGHHGVVVNVELVVS